MLMKLTSPIDVSYLIYTYFTWTSSRTECQKKGKYLQGSGAHVGVLEKDHHSYRQMADRVHHLKDLRNEVF